MCIDDVTAYILLLITSVMAVVTVRALTIPVKKTKALRNEYLLTTLNVARPYTVESDESEDDLTENIPITPQVQNEDTERVQSSSA